MDWIMDDDTYIEDYIERERKEFVSEWEVYVSEYDDDPYLLDKSLEKIAESEIIF